MARRRPKKYLDPLQTVVNREWMEWHEEMRAELLEGAEDRLFNMGYDPVMYLPEIDGKKIPEEGAWIIVIEEPPTDLRDRFRIPPLSMWRARPGVLNAGGIKIRSTEERRVSVMLYPQQAIITTPGGDVSLWAHEYVLVNDPRGLVSDPESTINTLGGEPPFDTEALFYLESRGIPHSEAVLMLFDQITSTDFMYVTFPEWVTDLFAGVGVRHAFITPFTERTAHV